MTDSTSPRILVTGFEPFEQDPVNPSWEVARALHGEIVEGATVHGLQLRCVFGESLRQLQEALAQLQPVLVISLAWPAAAASSRPSAWPSISTTPAFPTMRRASPWTRW